MKIVSKAKLELMPIPAIDPHLPRDFAARVEQINAQRAAVRRALSLDDALAALQSRAFRGEL